MNILTKIIISFLIVLVLGAVSSSLYFWNKSQTAPASKIEYIKVPEIKETIKIKRVEVPVEKIVTIEKKVLVEKMKLPSWINEDKNKQAIATAVIEPYEGKSHAVAIIDTASGAGEIVIKQEPLSLMGFCNNKQIYAKAGYTTNSETNITIGADWKFLRVGKIKVGVFGEGRADFNNKETKDHQNVEAVAGLVLTY